MGSKVFEPIDTRQIVECAGEWMNAKISKPAFATFPDEGIGASVTRYVVANADGAVSMAFWFDGQFWAWNQTQQLRICTHLVSQWFRIPAPYR